MNFDSIVGFLTSTTGIFAALATIVAVVGGILGIVRPILKERKGKRDSIPNLSLSNVKTQDPPPWSEAGNATFELVNTHGGKAVLSELLLVVLHCGVSEQPKMVEAAAPVPQFTYKVMLSPDVAEYDVRKREFGKPEPHSFEKREVESFLVELRTAKPQWYVFQFLIRWYDAAQPLGIKEFRSKELRIEFRPTIEDLLV